MGSSALEAGLLRAVRGNLNRASWCAPVAASASSRGRTEFSGRLATGIIAHQDGCMLNCSAVNPVFRRSCCCAACVGDWAGRATGRQARRADGSGTLLPARAFGSLLIIDASPAAVYLGKTLFLRRPVREAEGEDIAGA